MSVTTYDSKWQEKCSMFWRRCEISNAPIPIFSKAMKGSKRILWSGEITRITKWASKKGFVLGKLQGNI